MLKLFYGDVYYVSQIDQISMSLILSSYTEKKTIRSWLSFTKKFPALFQEFLNANLEVIQVMLMTRAVNDTASLVSRGCRARSRLLSSAPQLTHRENRGVVQSSAPSIQRTVFTGFGLSATGFFGSTSSPRYSRGAWGLPFAEEFAPSRARSVCLVRGAGRRDCGKFIVLTVISPHIPVSVFNKFGYLQ